MEHALKLYKNNKKSFTIKNIAKLFFILYIISLFIFVDNPSLNFISEIIFILFAFFTLIFILVNKKIYLHNYLFFFGNFIIICIASILWSVDYNLAFSQSKTLIQLFIMVILIFNLFINSSDYNIFSISIILSGYAMFFYSIYIYGFSYFINAIITGERLGSEINQINKFGLLSAISFVTCIYYAIYNKKNIFYFLSFLPFTLVIASVSRTAFFAVIFGIFILFFLKYGFHNIIKYLVYMTAFLIALYIILQMNFMTPIKGRVESLFGLFTNEKADSSSIIRKNMILDGIKLFKSKPLLGYGINNFRIITNYNTYSHNNFVELLVDVGLIGFIAYYMIFIYLLINLLKKSLKKSKDSILMFTILLIVLIMDMASVSYYSKMTYIYFTFGFLLINKKVAKYNIR